MVTLGASARRLLFACLVMALVSQMYVEAAEASESKSFGLQTNGIYRRLLQTIDCKAACTGRCKAASLNDRCLRACGTCCARCNCVPPGTYGNKQLCPCYANMKTRGNKPKCP
ncbi:hypothetical protein SUGI_0459060 [Cryptomeria japonica]|uniref:cypmaclein-like n=1 Tax=Cryptomeria japonica TaxID=3369 RepID=UPI002408AC37|nr:cypmaclein-like [Cryptomeria japonica]GLJ24070.1 hypothetical protein SUGI_0459060 [Cryptomeria japonica]